MYESTGSPSSVLLTTSSNVSPKSGLYSATKLSRPSASASRAPLVPSIVAIFTSSPGVRPASSTASAAPRPISSFCAKTSWMSLSLARSTVSKTLLASSADQFAVWAPTLTNSGFEPITESQPWLRSFTTPTPAGPSRVKYFAPSGNSDTAHSATEAATWTLSGAIRVTYKLVSSGSMPRSTRITGISASWARWSDASQPVASVAESRMMSTPSSTNDVNAAIWDYWSRLVAGAYRRSKPASSVKVSCTFCSFASRQAPSGPTATNPTMIEPSPPPSAVSSEHAASDVARVAAPATVPSRTRNRLDFNIGLRFPLGTGHPETRQWSGE